MKEWSVDGDRFCFSAEFGQIVIDDGYDYYYEDERESEEYKFRVYWDWDECGLIGWFKTIEEAKEAGQKNYLDRVHEIATNNGYVKSEI